MNFRVFDKNCGNCIHLGWAGEKPGCQVSMKSFAEMAGRGRHTMASSCICDLHSLAGQENKVLKIENDYTLQ